MIAAEGEQKASRALREAANVISESSSALQVRRGLRYRPRFFDRVGHETMYSSSGKKHFFSLNNVTVKETVERSHGETLYVLKPK